MTEVWENGPDQHGELIVLLAIADWADDYGVAWPSMARLAEKARCDRRTAQRIVRRLEDKGYLSTALGGIREGDRRVSNRYSINLSQLRGGVMPPQQNRGGI